MQAFLGDKYGKVKLPSCFTKDDFRAMTKALQDVNCDVSPLERWYWQDENDDAEQYFLRPISSVLGNKSDVIVIHKYSSYNACMADRFRLICGLICVFLK